MPDLTPEAIEAASPKQERELIEAIVAKAGADA